MQFRSRARLFLTLVLTGVGFTLVAGVVGVFISRAGASQWFNIFLDSSAYGGYMLLAIGLLFAGGGGILGGANTLNSSWYEYYSHVAASEKLGKQLQQERKVRLSVGVFALAVGTVMMVFRWFIMEFASELVRLLG